MAGRDAAYLGQRQARAGLGVGEEEALQQEGEGRPVLAPDLALDPALQRGVARDVVAREVGLLLPARVAVGAVGLHRGAQRRRVYVLVEEDGDLLGQAKVLARARAEPLLCLCVLGPHV